MFLGKINIDGLNSICVILGMWIDPPCRAALPCKIRFICYGLHLLKSDERICFR